MTHSGVVNSVVAVALAVSIAACPASALTDIALGALQTPGMLGHAGTYPNGLAGLSMGTTACNLGDSDVPWIGPMDESHPGLAMALYREHAGRFEQIGVSWIRHEAVALAQSECDLCSGPSPDGSYLRPFCSNARSTATNGDRTFLGPRDEWNGYTGTWECTGSYFADGEPDCVWRHSGSGFDPVEHRLVVSDADLGWPGANYYYEALYLTPGDEVAADNYGSRRCTMNWTGSAWVFATPGLSNPLVSGPAIERWGEIRTLVGPGVGDGLVILAVDTSDLGGGVWRYEYALHNRDSHRAVRGITIPVGAGTAITNVGFHDSDFDPANDWIVTLEDGRLSWSTGEYGSAGANPLDYGLLYNVRFDAALAPENTTATLETFRPGAGAATYGCPTRGPAVATSVIPTGDHDRAGTLGTCHPMPATSEVRIPFAISRPTMVSLAVFGSDGRRVRDLAAREFPAGNHEIMWRGDGDDGRDVAPGVYYLRFETGGALDFRSVVIAR